MTEICLMNEALDKCPISEKQIVLFYPAHTLLSSLVRNTVAAENILAAAREVEVS